MVVGVVLLVVVGVVLFVVSVVLALGDVGGNKSS